MNQQKLLGQFPTPVWVADALYRLHFSDLKKGDVLLEPGCGKGHFLQVVPPEVEAIGIEVDPDLAAAARSRTGRRVIEGDFTKVSLDFQPTVVLGNPPFQMHLVDRLLDRCRLLLPQGGRAGLILPAYAFQTASAVVRYNEHWSIAQEFIPRNIYPGLSKPLVFALFTKDAARCMVGFSLYHEAVAVSALPAELREHLQEGVPSWIDLVSSTILELGGEAELQELYTAIVDRRPTTNPAWREQIRKICQKRMVRTGRGKYSLPETSSNLPSKKLVA